MEKKDGSCYAALNLEMTEEEREYLGFSIEGDLI